MDMNGIDFGIISFFLLSGAFAYFNGFVKELFSFLVWLFSFLIAIFFLEELSNRLIHLIPLTDLRLSVALITLFFTSLILLEWLNYLILNVIGRTQVTLPSRILGILFSIGWSGIIVTLLILLSGLTQLPNMIEWKNSFFIQLFKPTVMALQSYWPLEIATQFNFDSPSEFQPPSF